MQDLKTVLNEQEEEDTQKGRFLTFALGEEVYGIEICMITEIIGLQPITKMPEVPDYVKGIINLRGKIIPVIDMRIKFRKDSIQYTDRTCIIVVDIQDIQVGLIVDQVAEVLSIENKDIVPPPDHKTGANNRYIQGIGKVGNDVKLLLDCEMLFKTDELSELDNIA